MKRNAKYSIYCFIMILLVGCSESDQLRSENTTLKRSIDSLKMVVEELENGADRLWASAQKNYKDKKYNQAKIGLSTLIEKHPEFIKITEVKNLLTSVDDEIVFEKQRKELYEKKKIAEQQRIEQDNLRAEKERMVKATSKMYSKYDKIEGITWYHDKSSPQYVNYNAFYLYIGIQKKNSPWLRWRVSYAADDWFFIKSFFIKYDGKRFNKDEPVFKTDNGSGEIWEWYDDTPTNEEIKMLLDVAHSQTATIRFNGNQYQRDKDITKAQKQAILNVIDVYKALGGTL